MSGAITLRHPDDLTLEVLEAVAWDGVPLHLDTGLLQRIGAAHDAMLAALADGRSVYGVNTGMGYLAGTVLTDEEQAAHGINLLRGRAVGGPPFLSGAEARALMTARLAGFLSGHAGVSSRLCAFLADRLNDGFTPAIPREGSGSAGEIIPLAHAFGPLAGIGSVLDARGNLVDAAEALRQRGIEPYRPAPKEGIALIAGAPGALALAAAHRRAGHALYCQLLVVFACMIDAMLAPLGPYDPVLAGLARDPLMGEVLHALESLLQNSYPQRRGTQAPVSFRVVPQVLTHLRRTLSRLEEDVRRDLGAVTDSPAYVDNRFLSNGGFHAAHLVGAMDGLSVVLVQTAELLGQQIHRLLDHRFSGLPDQLTPTPGPQAGLVAVHKRAVAVIHSMRSLASPSSLGIADTSAGQEDAMTYPYEAADTLRQIESSLREVMACGLLTCRQAWSLRDAPIAGGLAGHAELLCGTVTPVIADRPLGGDITAVRYQLDAEAFLVFSEQR